MRDIVSVEVRLTRESRHSAAAALEAVAAAIRTGDVTTIPARYTFGMGLDLTVTEHDKERGDAKD